MQLKLI